MDKRDTSEKKFDTSISNRERACFEAGIKLGAIFHSLLSFPVKNDQAVLKLMEDGFTASFKNQPFVSDLHVKLCVGEPGTFTKSHEFDYTIVKDYMINVHLHLVYRGVSISARIEWIPEMKYPLMYINAIN